MMAQRPNGTDVDVWTMEDLVEAVEEFIRQQEVENYADVSSPAQDTSIEPVLEPVDIANNSDSYGKSLALNCMVKLLVKQL
jgi:hypothetical protein